MTSRRIVLNTFGSLGDLYPYLALALELKKRGYSPVIAANENHQGMVQSQEIDFVSIRPEPSKFASPQELAQKIFSSSGVKYLLNEILLPYLPESYLDLAEAVEGSELLISHPLSFAAPLVAQKRKIPWISSVLSPISLLSACDPPLFNPHLDLKPYPAWLNRLLISFLISRSRSWGQPIQAFRKKIGLSPIKDPFFRGQHSPDLVLGLFSSLLASPQTDWWKQVRQTGFIFYEPEGAILPKPLNEFLGSGSPPLVFTLGSAAVEAAGTFYRESILAAKALEERAVLLVGKNSQDIPQDLLSEEIIAVDYAPHFLLFPRAKALIHQGGIGTTAQALKAGKPMLVVPFGQDGVVQRNAKFTVAVALKSPHR